MKISNIILKTVAIVMLFISCKDNNKQKISNQGFSIKANITSFTDSTKVFLKNIKTDEIIDSTLIINDKFEFNGKFPDNVPEKLWLYLTPKDEFYYSNLLISNDNVKISGDKKDFPFDLIISGSKTQDEANILNLKTKTFDIKRDSLAKSFFKMPQEVQQEKEKEIWAEIRALDDTIHALQVGYVKSHINTYPGIINLGYLKNSLPKDTVKVLYNKLSDEIKSSKYAKVIEIYLRDKISEIGDTYHDFKAIDKNGDTINFSSLVGKYILLDFTSAYCGPCVQSAEELRLIDRTYSDSLEIVSFSGDAKKDIWLKSLERDSVSWISLWDGKGSFSETYIKYGVQGFPTFFLIGPKGKIIDKWIGYGKGSLEYKLKRFKNN